MAKLSIEEQFNIPILLIGGHILQHADHCFIGEFNLTGGNWVMLKWSLACRPRSFPHFLHDLGGEVGSAVRVDP